MYTFLAILMLRYVRRWVKLIPLKLSKMDSWKKTFLSLDLRISKNISQIGEAKVSKFKFMHTLSESKGIFAIDQKAIVLCFAKNIAFLLRHLVDSYAFTEPCQVISNPYHFRQHNYHFRHAKAHGKNYIKAILLLVCHLLSNRL